MSEKIKKAITIGTFLIIIFVMAVFSVLNLYNKYKASPMPAFSPAAFENDFKTNLFLRNEIIELQGFTQRIIGNNAVEDPELGSVIRNNWGQLTSLPGSGTFDVFRSNLTTITDACAENGIKQIYAQAPFKILPDYEMEQLPPGFSTEANRNADSFISMMDSRGVDVFDFRTYLQSQKEIPVEEIFFRTDHHWTIQSAFKAFSGFVEYMSNEYDFCTEDDVQFLTNKDNYNFITMEDCYLGSWGRRTGVMYAGVEDFTYITPAFDTNFSIKRVAGEAFYEAGGSFYDVIMSPKRVEKDKFGPSQEELAAGFGTNGIYTDLYSVYMDGFTAEMQMINHNTDSDKKILIFHDSFGFPFSSFMALSAKETRVIDLRNWNEDIKQYISDFQPDFVITLYNPDQ